MKWFQKLGEAAKLLHECLSEVGMVRAIRRAEMNMDRLLDRAIERHPRLKFLDKVFPPIEEPLRLIHHEAVKEPALTGTLVKDGLNELPKSLLPKDAPATGRAWLNRIASESAQLKPPSPPR